MPQERYRSLNDALQERFGEKIYKLSLNGGCTCPNRDGTLGTRGCIFCSAGGSGEFASSPDLSITEQIEDGVVLSSIVRDGKSWLVLGTKSPEQKAQEAIDASFTDLQLALAEVYEMMIGGMSDG